MKLLQVEIELLCSRRFELKVENRRWEVEEYLQEVAITANQVENVGFEVEIWPKKVVVFLWAATALEV